MVDIDRIDTLIGAGAKLTLMDERTANRTVLILCAVALPVLAIETAELFRRGWTTTAAIPVLYNGLAVVTGEMAWTLRSDMPK